jgi:hypothetical protein
MANFSAAGQQGGGGMGGLAGYGVAAGGGAIAAVGLSQFQQVKKDASLGKWVSLGTAGVYALAGNSAMGSANNAMSSANSLGGTYATDYPAIRSALQSLSTGQQNMTPGGYLGIATATQPTSSASVGAPAQTNNNIGIALLAVVLAVTLSR